MEGSDAFPEVPKETRNPDGTVTLRKGTSYHDMLPDLIVIRMATLANGEVQLIGLEFTTEFARHRWQRECHLHPVLVPNRGEPEGPSLFIVNRTRLLETPTASAAMDDLIFLLQKRMAAAASSYHE